MDSLYKGIIIFFQFLERKKIFISWHYPFKQKWAWRFFPLDAPLSSRDSIGVPCAGPTPGLSALLAYTKR